MSNFDQFSRASTIPENENLQKIMLAGAMYVEENFILEAIHDELAEENLSQDELKEILIEAFCSLDMNAGDADPYEVKEMIAEAWDINSKNELINRLESLQMGLHQNVIDELIDLTTNQKIDLNEYRKVSRYSDFFKEFDPPSFESFTNTVQLGHSSIKTSGIIAWDWARYVHLLRLSFLAKMIEEKEAYLLLKKLEKPMSERFKSWADFGQSFMNGRNLWAGEENSFGDVIESLTTDDWSPWKVFDYIKISRT
ncbi:MAG: DUF1266 domain-containing protein [Bdellovibrionaceae bacterium]|nr:DUF1266 domain-containing protein [Pseudobdellovibrionaceae bacterium]NUM60165.1 DUF1266 domain-containing protein [Pseudobdellovibrionaceae bacterium]